jgi:hypothetical protein
MLRRPASYSGGGLRLDFDAADACIENGLHCGVGLEPAGPFFGAEMPAKQCTERHFGDAVR